MKTQLLLPILAALAVHPCVAQSTNTPPPPPLQGTQPDGERMERLEHALHEMQGMNPAQRAQFLENHPRLQQYLSNHPTVAKGIASGPEAGAGLHDPGHPRVNDVNRRDQHLEQHIAQGVADGNLTSKQASTLEQKVQNIHHEEAKDMAGDNGHLTRLEERRLNHEETMANLQASKDKHGKGKSAGASGHGDAPPPSSAKN